MPSLGPAPEWVAQLFSNSRGKGFARVKITDSENQDPARFARQAAPWETVEITGGDRPG